MVQASDIRKHMLVVGSDGGTVGTVDDVHGDRIKLAKLTSADNHHHYVPLSSVLRVDEQVHLSTTASAALVGAPGTRGRGGYLPWILLGLALILALLLFKGCLGQRDTTAVAPVAADAAAPLPVESVALPGGRTIDLEPKTLNYELQRYLASAEAAPRTFTFDKLNFDTSSSAVRAEDSANVDALAQILAAYPQARVKIVGYTDARGAAPANAQLGQQRANAVAGALTGKGVEAARIEAVSGGETNPADTNATATGQFENRRTELVVTAK